MFAQPDPIDATLIKIVDTFHNYYRVRKNGGIQWATSKDVTTLRKHGKSPGDLNTKVCGYQEGANREVKPYSADKLFYNCTFLRLCNLSFTHA